MSKDNYQQHLTSEEAESIQGRKYFVQNQRPVNLKLEETTEPRSNTPTYSIVCPKCGTHNDHENGFNIWARHVTKSNSRSLRDALDSGGDSLHIGFECELCNTSYELVVAKRAGFQLSLRETGFTIYE